MGWLIDRIIYMVFVLPFFMLQEGWKIFKNLMNKHNWWWAIPYALIVVLLFILLVLWTMGYR